MCWKQWKGSADPLNGRVRDRGLVAPSIARGIEMEIVGLHGQDFFGFVPTFLPSYGKSSGLSTRTSVSGRVASFFFTVVVFPVLFGVCKFTHLLGVVLPLDLCPCMQCPLQDKQGAVRRQPLYVEGAWWPRADALGTICGPIAGSKPTLRSFSDLILGQGGPGRAP